MIDELKVLADERGYKFELFHIDRFESLRSSLEQMLKNEPNLHEKQYKGIDTNIRQLRDIPSKYTTVLVVALSRRKHLLEDVQKDVIAAVKKAGYAIKAQQSMPLKRIAVQSGLAKYGRNNVVNVDGMGSWLRLAVFLTDIPIESDNWREQPVMSEICENCDECIKSCPADAIPTDRFLLYSEKCKNCPICQMCCPINTNGDTNNDGDAYTLTFNQPVELPDIKGRERYPVVGVMSNEVSQFEHLPENVADGSLETRWSADGFNSWVQIDLGEAKPVSGIAAAFYNGNKRKTHIKLQISVDGIDFETVYTGFSNGKTCDYEIFEIAPVLFQKACKTSRYIRLIGRGNTKNEWTSVTGLGALGE